MYLKTCHEILVLEFNGDCCSRLSVCRGGVHYRFKLLIQHYLEIFIWEGSDEYALNKIKGEIFHGFAVNLMIGSFILA